MRKIPPDVAASDGRIRTFALRYADNGRPALSSPPCLYGCPLTLGGHEVTPPRAETYHWTVWARQVRAGAERIDGQGGRWHALGTEGTSRIWVAE